MKMQLVTIGKPKLAYAAAGFDEYLTRLKRLHSVQLTQLSDKYAYDTPKLLAATQGSYRVALVIDGPQHTSHQLAAFLSAQELAARQVSFVIGGPDGLPSEFIAACDMQLSFSKLTFPHDLAMVILAEAVYRAASINAGLPYHH